MQIKTTMRCHLTPVGMAGIKKTRHKREPLVHCWWECKPMQPLRKGARTFLKKLKIELPHDLAIPLLGIRGGTQNKWELSSGRQAPCSTGIPS